MIFMKIYFLTVLLISCLSVGLRLFFYPIDYVLLKFVLASVIVSVPLIIGIRVSKFGDKINEVFRRDN
jgi:hypothetical protein